MKTAIKFVIWIQESTQHVQSNCVFYKKKHYFIDGEKRSLEKSSEGDLEDLYSEFVKDNNV